METEPLQITYREDLQPEDIHAIRDIVESTGFFSEDEIDIAIELARERLEKGPSSGYLFLFADFAGRVAGYACYGQIGCTRASYDLYWIAVHQDMRGKGLGGKILRRCEDLIRRLGGTRIYLETSSRPQYEPTRQFYLKSGYTIETVLEDFYAPGDGKVIFLKVL
ncbi:GNAT family N-acetyltransferase [bacterium]|nr:GNAT family N-acetyltransferase [candidate division CSSED10-310 bacterium]